jgi:hypothetical protein
MIKLKTALDRKKNKIYSLRFAGRKGRTPFIDMFDFTLENVKVKTAAEIIADVERAIKHAFTGGF